MTSDSIHLRSLHFPSTPAEYSPPERVVADFPARLLYMVARVQGSLPPLLFTPEGAEANRTFYRFVSTEVANRFYEDGLSGAVPGYDVRDNAHVLAYYPLGTKAEDSPRQQLTATFLDVLAASGLFGEVADLDRRRVAEVLAQAVINEGWRQATVIGR